jgi:hypothetical protein
VRIGGTRCYQVRRPGIRTLAGLLTLREKVLKPVLAGVCRPKRGRPPKNIHPRDEHYQNLQREICVCQVAPGITERLPSAFLHS